MLLPLEEDLPKIASIRFPEEIEVARSLASRYGFALEEETLPIQVIGSGKDLNAATANGLKRMASFTGLPLPEIKNRCTITGQVEIGRLPGVVQVTMLVPKEILEKRNLWETVLAHYEEF
jgi:acetamidase/formamidase